jgi:nitroimidazol reductase NimA-like FMN-containing flavoprotein (pyridoxamine 5'-phosphate oxidase superfamily)
MENAMSSPELAVTERTRLRRLPQRGSFERARLNAILDEALWCHLGFVLDGQPFVIPTIHARIGERLYVHGSAASRMLRAAAGGLPVCVTASLLDGLVLARSAFHHSMNYRSVVVLGCAREVVEAEEKHAALRAIVEHVAPGRSRDVRGPSPQELKGTTVLWLPIEEASAKVRSGPPLDDEDDYALPCWAGVLPLRLTPGEPLADPRLPQGVPVPGYVSDYQRPKRG